MTYSPPVTLSGPNPVSTITDTGYGISQILSGTFAPPPDTQAPNAPPLPTGGGSGTGQAYTRTTFVATAGQTTFVAAYTVGLIQIFVNGVLLGAADYTASNLTSFVLATPCNVGDIVESVAFNAIMVTVVPLPVALGGTGTITSTGTGDTVLSSGATLTSPTLLGVPASTTAALGTSTSQIATTAFVAGQAGTSTPVVNGTATVGTSTQFARQDHVHPTDTSRAPTVAPSLTGNVAITGTLSLTGNSLTTGNTAVNGNSSITGTLSMGSSFVRNRLINGAMSIDQRNAGASGAAGGYTVDRWAFAATQSSKLTWGQSLGGTGAPAGFNSNLGFQSSSAYTLLSSDYFIFYQVVEGYNFADFSFGTASAQTVTLSFWAYSTLAGSFGGSLGNSTGTRSFPFLYSLPAPSTWTYVTVTIPGDTTGTWVGATNGVGVIVRFSLGAGSAWSGVAGSWQTGNYVAPAGATSVVGTNGAIFLSTGVQLEAGTVATPFEQRQFGQELALCQRYYQYQQVGICTNAVYYSTPFRVSMRTVPTVTYFGLGGGTQSNIAITSDSLGFLYSASAQFQLLMAAEI